MIAGVTYARTYNPPANADQYTLFQCLDYATKCVLSLFVIDLKVGLMKAFLARFPCTLLFGQRDPIKYPSIQGISDSKVSVSC